MKFTPDRDGFLTNLQENGRARARMDDQEDLSRVVDEIRNAALDLGLDAHEIQIREGIAKGELFVTATPEPLPTRF